MGPDFANEWLTAVEAARYLKVRPRTVLAWAKAGQLRGHILSGSKRITWRFRRSDLDAKMLAPSAAIEHGGFNAAEK